MDKKKKIKINTNVYVHARIIKKKLIFSYGDMTRSNVDGNLKSFGSFGECITRCLRLKLKSAVN